MEERLKLRKLKWKDVALLLILSAIAAGLLLWFWFGHQEHGAMVEVSVDGEVLGTYPLDEEREIWIDPQAVKAEPLKEEKDGFGAAEAEREGGPATQSEARRGNRLLISEQTANMIWADCPDQICVHQTPISHVGETIICLPNRVAVTIVGDGATGVDATVR